MHSKQVGLTKCDGLEYWIYPNLTGPEVRGSKGSNTWGTLLDCESSEAKCPIFHAKKIGTGWAG